MWNPWPEPARSKKHFAADGGFAMPSGRAHEEDRRDPDSGGDAAWTSWRRPASVPDFHSESHSESTQSSCHVLNFSGSIIYCRTKHEVEQATVQLLDKIKTMKTGTTPVSLGFDVEWRPNFIKGGSRNNVAVMQLCVDDSHCFVFHIFHSGIPPILKSLLSETETIKVGIGIISDAEKIMEDYDVRVEPLEDLSTLANLQFGGPPRNWGLATLVEKLTSKKLPKSKSAKMGNWERNFLESRQLQYAATDAFASLKIHEELKNYPLAMSEDNGLANVIGGVQLA